MGEGLNTYAFTTEVSVVKLNRTAEPVGAVALGHGSVDLVVQQPGRGVSHPQDVVYPSLAVTSLQVKHLDQLFR